MKKGGLRIVDVEQGSEKWHKLRRTVDITASEVPALMGVDPRTTRTDLMNRKNFGIEKEVDDYTQRFLFDRGHEAEASARTLVELDEFLDLPPVVGIREIDGVTIMASLDGRDAPTRTIWEHKLHHSELARQVADMDLPAEKYYQIEAQLLVFGDDRVLFTVSDGTEDNMVTTEYRPHENRQDDIIAAVKQFKADLEEHQPPDADVIPEGVAPAQLPALQIQITGSVTQSNLTQFRAEALDVIASIDLNPTTDQEFADGEAAVKYCADVEKKITAALDYMLSQAGDIDRARREVEDIREMFRRTRLDLDKRIKSRKQHIRADMINHARIDLEKHIDGLNQSMLRPYMPDVSADFVGAQKGTKTQKSAQAKIDQELADAKIRATEVAKRVGYNLKLFFARYQNRESLFPDLRDLVQQDPPSFDAICEQRVKQAEAEKAAREKVAQTSPESSGVARPETGMPPAVKTDERPASPFGVDNPPPDVTIIGVIAESFDVDQDVAQDWLVALVRRLEPAETEQTETVNDTEKDARGVPWMAEAHSAAKSKTKSGAWRAKKGAGKERIAELEAPYLS